MACVCRTPTFLKWLICLPHTLCWPECHVWLKRCLRFGLCNRGFNHSYGCVDRHNFSELPPKYSRASCLSRLYDTQRVAAHFMFYPHCAGIWVKRPRTEHEVHRMRIKGILKLQQFLTCGQQTSIWRAGGMCHPHCKEVSNTTENFMGVEAGGYLGNRCLWRSLSTFMTTVTMRQMDMFGIRKHGQQ
jgi:hypothetical protein